MQSSRCVSIVKNELDTLGLSYKTVELGTVDFKDILSDEHFKNLDAALKKTGLELIYNKEAILIEKIKEAISQLIFLKDGQSKPTYSTYISQQVNYDYPYLSNLFSGIVGTTIEKYIITKKIERVKEMLVYEQLSLSDIAFKLQYSSISHLSNQFKKVTGLTPTFFMRNRKKKNQNIPMCEMY